MTYLHKTGGFSAFGENSYGKDNASTLLTSFVIKCFRAANSMLDKKAIDDQVIADNMNWLAQKYEVKGSFFREDGKVFSSYLMGAITKNGPITSSAYVLISLVENGIEPEQKNMVESAMNMLSSNLDRVEDALTLSMITYVLTKGQCDQ